MNSAPTRASVYLKHEKHTATMIVLSLVCLYPVLQLMHMPDLWGTHGILNMGLLITIFILHALLPKAYLSIKDECQSSPCRNGASCQDIFDGYRCQCPPSYTGLSCSQDVDECSQTPGLCQHGSTCVNTDGGFICSC
ncbi:unnamed protein product, partial [Candidula unifasciata]